MAKMLVFTIHDTKVGAFDRPFFAQTIPAAFRMLSDTVASGGSLLSDHPEDFAIYQIGTFDTETGMLEAAVLKGLGTLDQFKPGDKAPAEPPLLDAMRAKRSA